MSKIIVLGGGMVGSAMAIDLAKNHKVVLTDINNDVLLNVKNISLSKDSILIFGYVTFAYLFSFFHQLYQHHLF